MVDQFFEELVIDVIKELNGIPVFVIHMKSRNNGSVSFSKLQRISRIAFEVYSIEVFDVYYCKYFSEDLKNKCLVVKWEAVACANFLNTKEMKLLYIHGD